jgi:hypothetical protein
MEKCKSPEFENLLHAYELDMLSDADRSNLEIHLLECESCFQKSLKLKDAAAVIKSDKDAKNAIYNIIKKKDVARPSTNKILHLIWPGRSQSIVGKFIRVAALLLIIAFPVYKFAFDSSVNNQFILDLYPLRGNEDNVVVLDSVKEVIINFTFDESVAGIPYRIDLLSRDGHSLYSDSNYTEFNQSRVGSILISSDKFKPGYYALRITRTIDDTPEIMQEYYFKVE